MYNTPKNIFFLPSTYCTWSPYQLDRLISGLETYVGNWSKARQEIGIAFTNEEFTKHVQVQLLKNQLLHFLSGFICNYNCMYGQKVFMDFAG